MKILYQKGIKFSDLKKKIHLPERRSHKGQNGKVLVVGGSRLFHAAPVWTANAASYIVDMVHLAVGDLNQKVLIQTKARFWSGIVVPFSDLLSYLREDDVVIIGPGIPRGRISDDFKKLCPSLDFDQILRLEDEVEFYYALIFFLFKNFPEKKFLIDAGALQIMEPEWLDYLEQKILTPHQREFSSFFGVDLQQDFVYNISAVERLARSGKMTILLKKIQDYISDGKGSLVLEGGNAGLTKGGTGDVLSGLVGGLWAKSSALASAAIGSFVLKKTAEELFLQKGYWYNIDDLLANFSKVLKETLLS